MTHKERCQAECTRDVIFLFQTRRWNLHGCPDGYSHDGEGVVNDENPNAGYLRWEDLAALTFGDDDHPCATPRWETVGVWLDREEAEEFGRRTAYNFRHGWQVYGIPAEGQLAAMLRGGAVVQPSGKGDQ